MARIPPGYAPDNAEVCLDRVQQAYQDAELSLEDIRVVLQFGEPCDELVRGPTPTGGGCTADTECDTLEGERCVKKPGSELGACHVPIVMGGGEPCDAAEVMCADGFFCRLDFCARRGALDAACMTDDECSEELRCIVGSEGGACGERVQLSGECAADSECLSGYCSIETGEALGLCSDRVTFALREPVCEDLK